MAVIGNTVETRLKLMRAAPQAASACVDARKFRCGPKQNRKERLNEDSHVYLKRNGSALKQHYEMSGASKLITLMEDQTYNEPLRKENAYAY